MKDQTLLYLTGLDIDEAGLKDVLNQARGMNARVAIAVLAMLPSQPINAYGHMPYGGLGIAHDWVDRVQTSKKALKQAEDQVEALLAEANVSGDVQTALGALSDLQIAVAQRAMASDLAAIAPSMRDGDEDLFNTAAFGVLFHSPVGLVLNGDALTPPKRIFVAWNSELPSARAIHAALPMLATADEVIIGTIDPKSTEYKDGEDPGTEIAAWLSHRGCEVTVGHYPSGGATVASAIAQHAKETGADIVVMGAFGRSRMRELVFGGTTDSMLRQTEVPIFLAH